LSFLKNSLDYLLLLVVFTLGVGSLSKSFGLSLFIDLVEQVFGSDKHLHFFAGAVLILFLFRLISRVTVIKQVKLSSFFVTTLLILCDELIQLFVPTRLFSVYDIFAGLLGAVSMLLLLSCCQSRLAKHLSEKI